jgi:hypothetical protein
MRLEEIRPGLHRWTARSPEWTPQQGGADGWQAEVGCVAWEGEDALVLVDPLVSDGDWGVLDGVVERHGGPVALVTTCPWHARSGAEVVRRYVNSPGVSSCAHETAAADRGRITWSVDVRVSGEGSLPGGIQAISTDEQQGEITLWIESIRTVVAGDVLLGAEGERSEALRVCPQAWLEPKNTADAVKERLRRLLERQIDAVVPLHGAPVLNGAKQALERALN